MTAWRSRSRSILRSPRILLLCLAWTAAWPGVPADAADEPPEVQRTMASVALDGHLLFRIAGVSAFPAETRAAAIRKRIQAIARDRSIPPSALHTVPAASHVVIMAGDREVMEVHDADSRVEGVSPEVLASAFRKRIQEAIGEYRRARSPDALLRSTLYSVGATVALVAIGLTVLLLGRRMDALIARRVGRHIQSLGIQSFEIVRAERIWAAVRYALRALRLLALAAMALVYLHFVLEQFPWTREAANHIFDLVTGPLVTMGGGVLDNIPNAVFLVVLFFVARFLVRVTRLFFDAVAAGSVSLSGFSPEWAHPTYRIARLVIVAFALVVAYPYIPGSRSAAFQGISIFLGVLLSLGGASVIANMISGYALIYRRAFAIGDRVKIGDVVGDVIEMRPQVTHLRSPKNEEVIVPNSEILTRQVVNYTSFARERGLILHTTVGIGYETPWRQVEAMLLMAAERTPGLLREPRPFVLEQALADFAVQYELNVYCDDPRQMVALYAALHRSILDVFNEYGVQIMTPAYEGDPAEPKIVPRGQWHAAPAAPGATAAAAPIPAEPPHREAPVAAEPAPTAVPPRR